MQRTYLALAALVAGSGATALLTAPLQANTVPSRAPLAQNQRAGDANAPDLNRATLLRLAEAALQAADAQAALPITPPPPPRGSAASPVSPAEQRTQIVALEVIPYQP